MAQIITISTDDSIYIGTTSVPIMTFANNAIPENDFFWVPKDCKHTIICAVNSFSILPYFKNKEDLIKEEGYGSGVNKPYLMHEFVPNVISTLQGINYIKKGQVENLDCNMIIASKNKDYLLGYSGNIRELPEVYACPNSNAFEIALYEELQNLDEFTMDEKILIMFYYGWLSEHNIFIPIKIIDTKNIQTRTYYMEDILKVIHRFEGKEE